MKERYAEHFVGRRREQHRLLSALRRGDLQLVIITGMGGSGKSTLATRLARRLVTVGFILIPVSSSRENLWRSVRLLQAFGDAFRKAGIMHKAQGKGNYEKYLILKIRKIFIVRECSAEGDEDHGFETDKSN